MTDIPLGLDWADAGTEHQKTCGQNHKPLLKTSFVTGKIEKIKLGLTVCLLQSDSIMARGCSQEDANAFLMICRLVSQV